MDGTKVESRESCQDSPESDSAQPLFACRSTYFWPAELTVNAKNQIFESVLTQWPFDRWAEFTVLVAVSGGADSVCLVRVLNDLFRRRPDSRGHIELLYVDHGIREDSALEAKFVQNLADEQNLLAHFESVGSQAGTNRGQGLEALLRARRYEAYENIAEQIGARYVVTAHHLDDQVETILHRLFRGTGVTGLRGIPASRKINESLTVVRPFLGIRKQEILDCLEEYGQSFCRDETNFETQFTRNKIRNQLLPDLREMFGDQVEQALLRLSESAHEMDEFLGSAAESVQQAFAVTPQKIVVDKHKCHDVDSFLIRRRLYACWEQAGFSRQDMTRQKWLDAVEAIIGESTAREKEVTVFQLPGGVFVNSGERYVTFDLNRDCPT